MAFEFLTTLKALGPAVASSGLGNWLVNRFSGRGSSLEQRVSDLENGMQQQTKTLIEMAEQLEILANLLAEKDRQIRSLQTVSVVAWIALLASLAALGLIFFER